MFKTDLGIHHSMIYRWRKIYTESGEKTKVAEQQDQLRKLQLELAELKMENEMLKKAAAYVCHDADAQE
jgi:transposase